MYKAGLIAQSVIAADTLEQRTAEALAEIAADTLEQRTPEALARIAADTLELAEDSRGFG